MARRVNTKFVIALSLAITGVVGAAGSAIVGPKLLRMYRDRNPEVILARAEAQEKAGDLKSAAGSYARAADKMALAHIPGADQWYLKAADLSEQISNMAKTADEAVSYYQTKQSLWALAKRENPRNKDLTEKLLDEQYLTVDFSPDAEQFAKLQRYAEDMVTLEASAKAYTYLAKAKYRQLMLSASRTTPLSTFDDIEKQYLDEADKLDSAYPLAVALRAEIDWKKAQFGLLQINVNPRSQPKEDATDEAKKTWREAIEGFQGAAGVGGIETRLRKFLDEHGGNADIAEVLAGIIDERDENDGRKDKSQLDAIVTLFEKALEADSDNKEMALRLAGVYRYMDQPEKSVEVIKRTLIDRHPESPEGYARLGDFQMQMHNTEAAIEAYKEVRQHPQIGTGHDAYFNHQYQLQALENLAWLDMDLAEKEGVNTPKGQALMKQSAEQADTLRKENVVRGVLQMLDGRAQLLGHDIAQATKTLRAAEDSLNKPQFLPRLRKVELLLADANRLENQPGRELEMVEKALQIPPNDAQTVLRRGGLLLQVGRFEDAQEMMKGLMGPEILDASHKGTGHYENEETLKDAFGPVYKIYALADVALHKNSRASAAGEALRDSGAALAMAQIELNDGDNEAAAADAASVIATAVKNSDAENSAGYQIAVIANMRMAKKDEAKRLALEAKAKFPKNSTFQAFAAELAQVADPTTPEAQMVIFEAISDEFAKQMIYAGYYLQQQNFDESLARLQKAEAALGPNPDRDQQRDMVDRAFSTALAAAKTSKADKKKSDTYWDMAQKYASEAEKLNLDGTGGRLYQGRLQMDRTENKDGLKFLEQAVAQRPDYAQGRVILGIGYIRVQNLAAALDEFREAVKLAPNNLLAIQYAIQILGNRGDSASIEEARTLLRTGQNLSPYNRVFALYQDLLTTNVQAAIDQRLAMMKRDPDDLNNKMRLAALYVRDGKPESRAKAVDMIEQEFGKHPSDLTLADMLARLYMEQASHGSGTDPKKGLDVYGTFISNPDKTVQFRANLMRAEYAHRAGMIDEAVTTFNNAIKIEPEDTDEAERHLGDMYFELSRWQDAEAVYVKTLAKSKEGPAQAAVSRRLIETQLRGGGEEKVAIALKSLTELLKANPKDQQALVLQAFAEIQQRKIAAAIKDLNAVMAIDPANVEALYYRAMANSAQNKFDDAIHDLVSARSADRGAVNVRMLLAQLYQQTQRYGEAALEYSETIDLHPELMNVRVSYINFLLGLAKMEKNFPKEGGIEFVDNIRQMRLSERLVTQIKEAADKFPASPYWWVAYAQFLTLDGNPRMAHSYYKQLVERPDLSSDPQVKELYLGSMVATEDYQGAADLAKALLDANPGFVEQNPQYVTIYLKRAKALAALKKVDEAAVELDNAFSVATKVAKEKHDYSVYLSVLADSTDKDEPAPLSSDLVTAVLRKRIVVDPTESMARMGLVQMLLLDNKTAEAAKAVEEIQVPSDPVVKGLYLRQRAVVQSQNKQYDLAARDFEAILKDNPEDVQCLNNYAFMLVDNLKNPDKAIQLALQAVTLLNTKSTASRVFSAMPVVQDTLGWAYLQKGETDKAVITLRGAAKLQPIPLVYYHLALAYQKQADPALALATVLDGIKLATPTKDPILPEMEKLRKELAP